MTDFKEHSDNLPLRILYYLHQQGDESKYALSLDGVAQLGPEDDEYGQRTIIEWFVAEYAQPTVSALASISIDDARTWYHQTYEAPARAGASSGIMNYSTKDLAKLQTMPQDTVVLNSDDKKLYYYDSESKRWHPVSY